MNKRRIIINRKKQLRSYFSHLWVVSKISRQDFRKNFLLGDLPCGEEDQADGKMQAWMDKTILFTENPRKIESAVLTKEGYRIKIEAVIDGEQKVLYAGYKAWKCNDLYPSDFTKRYHSVAYAMDAEALYLSVGLINTSYKEEYCLWVNSEDKVIATWRPNVTYLPEEPDMVWKFTGTFE